MRVSIQIGNAELIIFTWGVCLSYDWRYIGWNSREGFVRCLKSEHQEVA